MSEGIHETRVFTDILRRSGFVDDDIARLRARCDGTLNYGFAMRVAAFCDALHAAGISRSQSVAQALATVDGDLNRPLEAAAAVAARLGDRQAQTVAASATAQRPGRSIMKDEEKARQIRQQLERMEQERERLELERERLERERERLERLEEELEAREEEIEEAAEELESLSDDFEIEGAEEVREVLDAFSERIPNLMRGIQETVFSAEQTKKVAESIATFYRTLVDAGLDESHANSLTMIHMSHLQPSFRTVSRRRSPRKPVHLRIETQDRDTDVTPDD